MRDNRLDELRTIIQQNQIVYDFLFAARHLNLSEYYIGAGCITQTIWNYLSGFPLQQGIKDIDFVYFDPHDLSREGEEEVAAQLSRLRPNLPIKIDVKNQARVHLWYRDRFGYDIKPYLTLEDAIDTWPTTATSLGVRVVDTDWIIYAPFGLDDVFDMIVRPNKVQITKEIYEKKVAQWTAIWQDLKVIPW